MSSYPGCSSTDARDELIAVLVEARELLALAHNDFDWPSCNAAVAPTLLDDDCAGSGIKASERHKPSLTARRSSNSRL